jgi:prevent-host-death family protein
MTTYTGQNIERAGRRMAAEKIGATEFKARCLALLDRVAEEHVEYLVTKHGRPVARVVPIDEPQSLDGSVTILVESDDQWFSTADLVELPGGLEGATTGR